jgi:hypothetical protein
MIFLQVCAFAEIASPEHRRNLQRFSKNRRAGHVESALLSR